VLSIPRRANQSRPKSPSKRRANATLSRRRCRRGACLAQSLAQREIRFDGRKALRKLAVVRSEIEDC